MSALLEQVIINFLRMFEALLIPENGFDRAAVKPAQFLESLNLYFAFTLVWSLGAPLDDASRPAFSGYVIMEHICTVCPQLLFALK